MLAALDLIQRLVRQRAAVPAAAEQAGVEFELVERPLGRVDPALDRLAGGGGLLVDLLGGFAVFFGLFPRFGFGTGFLGGQPLDGGPERGDGRVDARAGAELEVGETVTPVPGRIAELPGEEQIIYDAIVQGVRDYVHKNGFKGVVLGLSGGVDSALCLAVAVDALGPGAVRAVMMPYHYTSTMSLEDAEAQATILGVEYTVLPIAEMVEASRATLAEMFAGLPEDSTEENIQARCRGILLMAISNKTNRIVLTTGNKSEMAVGYATLYGDMAGGFAPIKDCTKSLVYRLARYRNTRSPAIPSRVIEREPSAELRPDQKDSDSLPPYDVLDPILDALMIEDLSVDEIAARGYDRETVGRILDMVRRNEYKRRQSPPGVRISGRAFGRDWRYPLTSGYGRGEN